MALISKDKRKWASTENSFMGKFQELKKVWGRVSYDKMFNAYKRIFDRMGINYVIVNASVGAMGGDLSEEFQAVTDRGEDTLVLCDGCDYASNLEVGTYKYIDDNEAEKELELVETPHCKTIEDVCKFLNIDVKKTVKAASPKINFVSSTYYKGTPLENVTKELEQYIDKAPKDENEINYI